MQLRERTIGARTEIERKTATPSLSIRSEFARTTVFKIAFSNFGNAQAMCITKRANPVLYVSNSNPWNDIDVAGEIYRMRLDGTVLGKFGRAGRLLKEFGAVNSIDCRSEGALFVGELANLRVQKLMLH